MEVKRDGGKALWNEFYQIPKDHVRKFKTITELFIIPAPPLFAREGAGG